MATRAAQASTETMSDQKCSHPRIRGLSEAPVIASRELAVDCVKDTGDPGPDAFEMVPAGRALPPPTTGETGAAGVVPVVGARELLYSLYELRLGRELGRLGAAQRPRHVALMLDGNRRWARDVGLTDVNDGHRVGAAKIAELLGWCDEADVEVVTLFLLSTDNLARPAEELEPLLEIIADVVDELSGPTAPWRLRVVGALDLLPHLLNSLKPT